MDSLTPKESSLEVWQQLRQFTDARIGLGRCGVAQPLTANQDFKLAHAQARDAVHAAFQQNAILEQIQTVHPAIAMQSQAVDRVTYLTRPDLGRLPCPESLARYRELLAGECFDLSLVVADGLSARAIHDNAVPFIRAFLAAIEPSNYRLAPIPVVVNARVAVSDSLGALCRAKLALILIGERPGLSSPDSMGIYLTYNPHIGNTDERRNCISNIRRAGLPIAEAVRKTCYLIEHALRSGYSGVQLKDNMDAGYLPFKG